MIRGPSFFLIGQHIIKKMCWVFTHTHLYIILICFFKNKIKTQTSQDTSIISMYQLKTNQIFPYRPSREIGEFMGPKTCLIGNF